MTASNEQLGQRVRRRVHYPGHVCEVVYYYEDRMQPSVAHLLGQKGHLGVLPNHLPHLALVPAGEEGLFSVLVDLQDPLRVAFHRVPLVVEVDAGTPDEDSLETPRVDPDDGVAQPHPLTCTTGAQNESPEGGSWKVGGWACLERVLGVRVSLYPQGDSRLPHLLFLSGAHMRAAP